MLGQDLCPILQDEGYEVIETDIDKLDVTDFNMVSRVLQQENPDIVVHCEAYTNVDKAEEDIKTARLINATGTENLAKICKNIENDNILFIPDCNLGDYVAKQIPEKNIKLLSGGCPIHACVNTDDVMKARALYPDAELLVHPECTPDVVALADYVGSTSGIMEYAINSPKKEFIIGTEISIAEHLQYMCLDKKFHYLSQKLICPNMKLTTLIDLYNCVKGVGGEEIFLDDDTIRDAKKCIDEMIRLG